MDYIEHLSSIYNRLIDDIGYIYIDSEQHLYITQKTGKIRIRNIYFDLKEGQFIKYSTIRNNKKVLMKLSEYQGRGDLICFIPITEGYRVRVFNKYGELIYKHRIKFFDKLNRLSLWYLRRRYEDLVLDK
jgi:hypothetical protein